ncbi:MAG: tetratricopeptide repeat protein [Labilithrix sp.]|nr:tetratricopeptide repeat protein [Labilithrix sp.]
MSDRETARGRPDPETLDAIERADEQDEAAAAHVRTFGDQVYADDDFADDGDRTVMAPSPPTRRADHHRGEGAGALDAIEPMDPIELPPMTIEPESAPMLLDETGSFDNEDVVDLADVEDVDEDVEELDEVEAVDDVDDEALADAGSPDRAADPAPSLFGTLPGHDVAQALRAMMGEVPDASDAPPVSEPTMWRPPARALDDGETQTRMPLADEPERLDAFGPAPEAEPLDAFGPAPEPEPDAFGRDEALPAFSLDDSSDDPLEESQGPWLRAPFGPAEPRDAEAPATARAFAADLDFTKITRPAPQSSSDREATAITRAVGPATRSGSTDVAETTAVFMGPVPSIARPDGHAGRDPRDPPTDEVEAVDDAPFAHARETAADVDARLDAGGDLFDAVARPESDPMFASGENESLDVDAFGRAADAIASFPKPDDLPVEPELPRFTLASIPEMPDTAAMPEPAPAPPDLLGAAGNEDLTVMRPSEPDAEELASSRSLPSVDIRMSAPSIDADIFSDESDDATAAGTTRAESDGDEVAHLTARLHREDVGLYDEPPPAPRLDTAAPPTAAEPPMDAEEIDDAEIVELVGDEIIEDDQTSTSIGAPVHAPPFEPPSPKASSTRPPFAGDDLDPEEKELFDERRFGPLIAVYRQRLADTDGPNRKAALLLKIAHVYETGLEDPNEAFQTLVEAFELAPDNHDVVSAVDRVGKETQRIGELADKVKRKLLPGSPDDKRVVYLGHLVYWYERVLGRGREVSSFVSEIERHDKVHPVVLKRAAQLAAMNADAKTQREHLTRALERTVRKEEKVALHLALASAYAGTVDALKHYEAALRIDGTSLVALQGVKRLGKEKERYDQVQWALERQAEVAPTEAERIDALIELAELQETKFLKREAAADLLERVLVIEPAHPAALKGLERCYHALRDWPRLARILGVRSEHTFDKKAKVELLELAAEVHESKLGDPASAVEVYRNLLVVEPKHRRALGDLARLYEKLGDWANVSTYKARLAELAPTKRASSQELVKLGDFLNTPDRDPIAAKLQYERAVTVDPTNAAGWEALQKLAAEAGDDRRVVECLEQRRKHTDVPRQRAAILVELARVHRAQGDDDAAEKAFEAAVKADPSNEIAAVAMLDAYTAEERWAEAAPLCELLVNAAIRDRDAESLFVRLRLATRIAAALGDADRALTSAIAALDAQPKDAGAQADLIAVASQCRESGPSVARAREHLARIAAEPDDLPTDHLLRLAKLEEDAGDLDSAAAIFERARRLEPEDQEVTRALAEVYLAQGDFPRACKLKVDMARNATNADTRFDLFCEAGEIWARRADELEKAASVFEEARALKPHDPWLLQTMMWLYGELGEWGLLTGVLEDAAQASGGSAEDRVKSLIAMAEVVRDKLEDRLRAADLYDQVLDVDKKRLDVFEELVRTVTEEKNWERLERAYRKMIARVKDDDEPQLQFLLFHQLGLIYRDRLGDASRAYDALDAASRLRPDDGEVRKIVIELLVVTDNLDNAVARLRDEIDRDPHEPQLYAELYELFLRQHFFDKAWCAVNVLSRLREPTPEQRRFHEDYAPMPLDGVPGQIVEQAWRSHVFHAELDEALTNIFALLTPAVARMRYHQLRPEQRVGRPFTPNHSRMHDLIRATFDNAAEILAVLSPELLLGDLKSAAPFTPALAPYGALHVCGPAVDAQSSSLIYLVGKRLAEQRPELAARAFFPSVAELTSLLHTAVRVSRNEVAKDAAGAALDQSFAAVLAPQEAAALRSVVLQATSEGAALDVKRWSLAAELSSMRAGLLIAGDVEPARDALLAEGPSGELSAEEKVGELYRFATSDLYSDLRGAIGVAVQA